MSTAIVVDGAYFLRRFKHLYPYFDVNDADEVITSLLFLTASHLRSRSDFDIQNYFDVTKGPSAFNLDWLETPKLYRIFFYDCPPLLKRTQLPISKKALDLSQTKTAKARSDIHKKLQSVRKVALRLGRLNDKFSWRVKADAAARWTKSTQTIVPTDDDFEIDTVQKGVDMRLGLDVASMAFKKQVDQIILVAGDADFVPAAKLARREGIDVVLDSMGGTPPKDLVAHVDGIRNGPRPNIK
jgi:uncharacterized LabA/DUF88 family protein